MKDKPTIEAPVIVTAPGHANPELNTATNIASTTTPEQDRKSLGQRTINQIWEYTQSVIALSVVITTCAGIFIGRVMERSEAIAIFPPEWWTILGLVIGFYFGRTNHARVGDNPTT